MVGKSFIKGRDKSCPGVKKIAALFIVAAASAVPVFAQDRIEWFSFGFELGNYFENYKTTGDVYKAVDLEGIEIKNSVKTVPGISIGGYNFWNDRYVGLFVNASFLLPSVPPSSIKQEALGNESRSEFSSAFNVGFLIGPGFRMEFSDSVKMRFGFGLDVEFLIGTMDAGSYSDILEIDFMLGIGGDMGFKFDVSKKFYIDIGALLTLDFAKHSSMAVNIQGVGSYKLLDDWLEGYIAYSVRPYICVGFNFYKESGSLYLGKRTAR